MTVLFLQNYLNSRNKHRLYAQSNWNVHDHTPSVQHSVDVGTGKL